MWKGGDEVMYDDEMKRVLHEDNCSEREDDIDIIPNTHPHTSKTRITKGSVSDNEIKETRSERVPFPSM